MLLVFLWRLVARWDEGLNCAFQFILRNSSVTSGKVWLFSLLGCAWAKSGMHCSCSLLSKYNFQLRLEQEMPGGFSFQGKDGWICILDLGQILVT